MRVLHIIDTLWLGGAQTLLKSLFEHQQDNEDIYLFALRKTEPQINIDHNNIVCFDSEKKLSIKRIKALKRNIKENNIDILHCHLPHAQAMGYIIKRFYFKKIKLIFHEHAEIFDKGKLLTFVLKRSKNKVDRYISCSKSSKVELIDRIRIDPFKILVLNNFVDLNKFNRKNSQSDIEVEREKIGINTDEFVVGFAGRLVERKGWKELLNAASELKSIENIKFLIAGIGPDQKEFLLLIEKLGLKDKVIYIGYYENMPLFYSLINCLAIPSYWEGMPIIQLEAAAMEVPVVCSNAPGLNDIFENFKDMLFSEIYDFKCLKENILKIYDDNEIVAELTKNAQIKVRQLNIEKFLRELNKIYNIVME